MFLIFVATKAQCTASVVYGAALLRLSLSLGNAVNGGSGKEGQGSKKYGLQKDIHTVDGKKPAPVDRWFIPLFIGFQPSL